MKFDKLIDLLENGTKLPLVEDFYTIQGEGFHTGKPAYFIRLGGCDVGCKWCDAKATWNPELYPPVAVSTIIDRVMQTKAHSIVITGGEPLIYPLEFLTSSLRKKGVKIFLETSGTHLFSGKFDWICLSPKKQMPPLEQGFALADELKMIIQTPEDFKWAEECALRVEESAMLYLQPEWSVFSKIVGPIVDYCKEHPEWQISLQTHKFMHIP